MTSVQIAIIEEQKKSGGMESNIGCDVHMAINDDKSPSSWSTKDSRFSQGRGREREREREITLLRIKI